MSEGWHRVAASLVPHEIDLPPGSGRGGFQIPAQVRQLLELGGQYGRFGDMMIGDAARAACAAAKEGGFAIPTARNLPSHHLPLTDQSRGKLRCTAIFAR